MNTVNKPLQLVNLTISRNTYGWEHGGIKPGQIGGTIIFGNAKGHEVKLVLTQQHVDAILRIIADSMVETTTELVNELTSEVIEHASGGSLLTNDDSVAT